MSAAVRDQEGFHVNLQEMRGNHRNFLHEVSAPTCVRRRPR